MGFSRAKTNIIKALIPDKKNQSYMEIFISPLG
jgi:hypothetical protein